MNASNAFRTNLMQQFANAARAQSRPPLALIGWLSEEVDPTGTGSNTRTRESTVASSSSRHIPSGARNLSSIHSSSTRLQPSISPSTSSTLSPSIGLVRGNSSSPSRRNVASPSPLAHAGDRRLSISSSKEADDGEVEVEEVVELPRLFQELLQTRRTRTHFVPYSLENDIRNKSYWMDILGRAALCGYTAPNHKRTEPFTFKRMVAPSDKTQRLSDIAYNVKLLQQMKNANGASREAMEATAERRRLRWNQIPAFLVTLVCSQEVVVDPDILESTDPYELLPYVPPRTERDLEDYASACAAVQNVLLSLHAEEIASKWVTGPVIRTPAFRELVEASSHDRVVSLIMVGKADESKRLYPRHRHRQLDGDVLVDL